MATAARKRTFWGLVVVVALAVLTWYLQGDDAATTSDSSPPTTAGATLTPSDAGTTEGAGDEPTDEPTDDLTDDLTDEPTEQEPTDGASVDPESGLPWISGDDLPQEASNTLKLIDEGGPFPYPDNDGVVFDNREGLLPDQPSGYYHEYTVETPGSDDRGARRIVTGGPAEAPTEYFWTDDHYRSFERIDT
jgi:ribonuclease T1